MSSDNKRLIDFAKEGEPGPRDDERFSVSLMVDGEDLHISFKGEPTEEQIIRALLSGVNVMVSGLFDPDISDCEGEA